MTYQISPLPWTVADDYVADANHMLTLRVMPQLDANGNELDDDGERARYVLQLAATAPELLAACRAVKLAQQSGNYADAFAAVDAAVTKATTVDFLDGNYAFQKLARKYQK